VTGVPVHKLEGLSSAVLLMGFAQDGAHLVSGSEDGMVHIWDVHDEHAAEVFALPWEGRGEKVFPTRTLEAGASWAFDKAGHASERLGEGSIQTHRGYKEEGRLEPQRNLESSNLRQFKFTSLGHNSSHGFIWFVAFEGNGKRKEVAIMDPTAIVDGPLAYCHDRLAISCAGGRFLLLDISKVIEGISLPNSSILF